MHFNFLLGFIAKFVLQRYNWVSVACLGYFFYVFSSEDSLPIFVVHITEIVYVFDIVLLS